jgi:hypothetical protein
VLVSGKPVDVMDNHERLMGELGRSVIRVAAETRAVHVHLVAEARAQRRKGRRLREQALAVRERTLDLSWGLWSLRAVPEPPSTIPLSWVASRAAQDLLQAAFAAAEECATECTRALRSVDRRSRSALASVCGVCGLAAERGHASHPDTLAALGLCVRVIEANKDALDRAGAIPGGVLAASAARRCAQICGRALAASYVEAGD